MESLSGQESSPRAGVIRGEGAVRDTRTEERSEPGFPGSNPPRSHPVVSETVQRLGCEPRAEK